MSRSRPDATTLLLLTLPPLLWASNAVVGRLAASGAAPLVSPLLLNTLRWAAALAILLAMHLLRRRSPPSLASPPSGRSAWRTYAVLGLLSVTTYNALQYQALRTSTAINVTLIAASGPLWMLLLGRLFFGERSHRTAWLGAGLSLSGVLVVLTGADLGRLAGLRLAPGDLMMLAAVAAWSLYSWLLRRGRPQDDALTFLLLQTAWGLVLGMPIVAAEWLAGHAALRPGWATAAVVAWVAVGPSLLAYWCWDRGVARAGAVLPMFFGNLAPLFAALMSGALLGEAPYPHHAAAFGLIMGGIALSQWRRA